MARFGIMSYTFLGFRLDRDPGPIPTYE